MTLAIPAQTTTWTYAESDWYEGNVPLIGPRSHAMWLASSVFDGARWFEGVAPDLDLHAKRLNSSAIALGLKPTMTAEEINFAIRFLAQLVEENDLPPKILIVHRFTRPMVRGAKSIVADPRVQLVIHMDGWGPPAQKLTTYKSIVAPEASQFTGFKLFYKNDQKKGSRMMRPEEILALRPIPFYIQYQ